MNLENLKSAVTDSVVKTIQSLYGFDCSDAISFTRPPSPEYGDWALSLPLRLSGVLKKPAIDIAENLAAVLLQIDGVQEASVAPPGFVNLKLSLFHTSGVITQILEQGSSFGTSTTQVGKKINLEFVSGNPTGPLHLAHTRWAAVGDSLARVLSSCGAQVVREYYINNVGNQVNLFSESVYARAISEPLPEGGYPGEYVKDIAQRILREQPDIHNMSKDEAMKIFCKKSWRLQIEEIEKSCVAFRVNFDVWFSEESLHEICEDGKSQIDKAIAECEKAGYTFEQDGTLFVRTTDLGDDKDRAVLRRDGSYTYYAADCAYYLNKLRRGFSDLICLVGADHHGYVKRFQALSVLFRDAFDKDTKPMTVLLGQMVSLKSKRQSKRTGNIITLTDVIGSIGVDPLRFWFCRYPIDTPIDLDETHITKRSNDNPVYYVQYAHARTCAVERNAKFLNIEECGFSPEALVHDAEITLISLLYDYREAVVKAGELYQPHRIVRYLEALAGAYHKWYDKCRIIPRQRGGSAVAFADPATPAESEQLISSRLKLNRAVGQVLRNALNLIGVSAPERM